MFCPENFIFDKFFYHMENWPSFKFKYGESRPNYSCRVAFWFNEGLVSWISLFISLSLAVVNVINTYTVHGTERKNNLFIKVNTLNWCRQTYIIWYILNILR